MSHPDAVVIKHLEKLKTTTIININTWIKIVIGTKIKVTIYFAGRERSERQSLLCKLLVLWIMLIGILMIVIPENPSAMMKGGIVPMTVNNSQIIHPRQIAVAIDKDIIITLTAA